MINPERKSTLTFEMVGDSMGVFDDEQQQAYMLNATAALVFEQCNGQSSTEEMATALRQKFNLGPEQSEEVVEIALSELGKHNLLHAPMPVTTEAPELTTSSPDAPANVAIPAIRGLAAALMPTVMLISRNALTSEVFGPPTIPPSRLVTTTTALPRLPVPRRPTRPPARIIPLDPEYIVASE